MQEQVSSKAWCSWEGCKKIVVWGDWKDEEWEKRQQNIQHLASCQPNCQINHAGLCNNDCDTKWCQKHGTGGPSRTPPQKDNQNAKKWGLDFGQLKPGQREGRIKTQNGWSEGKIINIWKD